MMSSNGGADAVAEGLVAELQLADLGGQLTGGGRLRFRGGQARHRTREPAPHRRLAEQAHAGRGPHRRETRRIDARSAEEMTRPAR